jgi:hypothetical protein
MALAHPGTIVAIVPHKKQTITYYYSISLPSAWRAQPAPSGRQGSWRLRTLAPLPPAFVILSAAKDPYALTSYPNHPAW